MEELDLKEIFNMFWARIIHIILIVLIFVVIGILYSYLYVSPLYQSETSLLLGTTTEGTTNNSGITSSDITLNNNLIATYTELLQSKSVLNEVIEHLGIDISEEALGSKISVSQKKSTQMLTIQVVDADPHQAKIIANEVAKVFVSKVPEYFNINNINIVDQAEEDNVPYNINHIKDIIIFAFIGLVVACVYVLIANMLDTTVKSKEDVERKMGLTVLVTIPNCNFDELPKMMKKGGKK